LNKIILCGRLTMDPELRTTQSGVEVCTFSIAVDRRFKDQNGDKQADFIQCVAWRKTGVFVAKYFQKGDGITVEGRVETRRYEDKQGNKRTAWEVICENVEFPLGKAAKAELASQDPVLKGFTELPESDLPF
jgi:single-strand DNA-binding protein